MSRWGAFIVLVWLGAGCAPALEGAGEGGTAGDMRAAAERGLVPAGFGTLRQDDATVSLRSGAVLVKVTPLDEATIRLLAPDTYARLHALRESRASDAAQRATHGPELFLVSFFSYESNATFQPEDVQLIQHSRLLRPAAILPVTAGWGRQQLAQQETQAAVYVFESPVEYDQTFIVRYGATETGEWSRILLRLEAERARVLTRAGT